MIYHVLPGDAQVDEFAKTKLGGKVIVCREVLATGPVDAPDLDQFWRERAHFILGEYQEDEITYHESVANELSQIVDVTVDDEVNLWFEYELFCSVNMWFCLYLLEPTEAAI